MKYMDDALTELDNVDSLLSTYKIHLNVIYIFVFKAVPTNFPQTVGEDIDYIQSQNRGLQVQTQNQRALLNELQNLLVCPIAPERYSTYGVHIANSSRRSGRSHHLDTRIP